MDVPSWIAVNLPVGGRSLVVDVRGSGRMTERLVRLVLPEGDQPIRSLGELAGVFAKPKGCAERLARARPAEFAFVVCVLAGRPHHVFPRDTMWPELETHFGLTRERCEPRVEGQKFWFVAYSQYMPVIRLSELSVDLRTFDLVEKELVNEPWPPAVDKVVKQVAG